MQILLDSGDLVHAGGPGGGQEAGGHSWRVPGPRQPRLRLLQQRKLQGKFFYRLIAQR